jgi:hypothetical protein
MNLEKYKQLKEKIRNKSFEKKYSMMNTILYLGSILGNIASIFFAYFLWFPSLLKTITMHVGDNGFTYTIAIVSTILLLGMIELLKRGMINIFSTDFIENNQKLNSNVLYGQFTFAFLLVGLSFYFSVNGAVEFSKTSGQKNVAIEVSNKPMYDSLHRLNEENKKPIQDEITSILESNKKLRASRDETPLDQRRARDQYTKLIADNEKLIENNNTKIQKIEDSYKAKISALKKDEEIAKDKNHAEDKSNVLLFFIVSTAIELFIVIGVYFRQLYIHKSFYEYETKLDHILQKKEKYEHLLKLIFKNGDVKQDEQILSVKKLTDIMKSKQLQYPPVFIKTFYDEMGHLGAFKVSGNKRYAVVSFEESKKLLDALENI